MDFKALVTAPLIPLKYTKDTDCQIPTVQSLNKPFQSLHCPPPTLTADPDSPSSSVAVRGAEFTIHCVQTGKTGINTQQEELLPLERSTQRHRVPKCCNI